MLRFGLILSPSLLIGLPASACSVPVFRYALERWQQSRYELVVYHRGPLGPGDHEAVRRLESAAGRANLGLTDADLAGRVDPALQALWDREGTDVELPRAVLRYPDSGPEIPIAWAGSLSSISGPLMDSPARRAIFDRLTGGHAGAIILLLSGDPLADSAARHFLQKQLPGITGAIALTVKTDDGLQGQSELPLWIKFPVVEVARTATEDALVRTLVGSEEGLAGVPGRSRSRCSAGPVLATMARTSIGGIAAHAGIPVQSVPCQVKN